jgi:hypothetical protein
MKEINNKEEKASGLKDYIIGIIVLVLPILIIYLIIKYF